VYYLFSLAFQQGVARLRGGHRHILFIAILSLTWCAAVDRPAARLLRGMSAHMNPRNKFLFSPWHLVLIPVAVAMLVRCSGCS